MRSDQSPLDANPVNPESSHLGFDASGLPDDLCCHYMVVNDWERGVDAEQARLLSLPPSISTINLEP